MLWRIDTTTLTVSLFSDINRSKGKEVMSEVFYYQGERQKGQTLARLVEEQGAWPGEYSIPRVCHPAEKEDKSCE
jgi:hypothetical protein